MKAIKTDPLLELAKKNRANFLEPYKLKFIETQKTIYEIKESYKGNYSDKLEERSRRIKKVEKDILKIISELIKIEPSHLAERWILQQVTFWMREHERIDFIDEIFIKQTNRNRPTEEEDRNFRKDALLYNRIEQLRKADRAQGGKGRRLPAFKRLEELQGLKPNPLYPQWSDSHEDQALWLNIQKAYYRHDRRTKTSILPFPYYDGMGGIMWG